MTDYEKYKEDVTDDIKTCIDAMGCQPILFVGSGVTRRYLNGPSWQELLYLLSKQCPDIDKKFAYYQQKYSSLVDIGTVFAEKFNDWAWGSGESQFPQELFSEGNNPDIYFKHSISELFEDLLKSADISANEEIKLLQSIHPHSIITTNYDRFLEAVFPNYTPIIGQQILYANHSSIGEIFKIHGCSSDATSIVITNEDYENFLKKKKYLSAKMLTFFAEHPLIFIGYSAEDANVRAILSDIDEILSESGELIPNIYHLEWSDKEISGYPRRERLISVAENKSIRIKSILAHDYSWVYEAFGANQAMDNVNPKLLRSLLARTYELVRSDIPKNPIQVDYTVLANVSESDGELAKLYGIAEASDGLTFNVNFPFTLSTLGRSLGYKGWHDANKLIEILKDSTNVDIKTFDNKYHCSVMNGDRIQSHRYSNLLRKLLEKIRDGEEYVLDLPTSSN
ncbi:SIR2 family protein [Pseudomonas coleopterorum]|uniref:SIR2 family protein n=1 Tax=Pseudomonas coleopterorum TaxID=1605838 RepID=A0AAJ6M3V1_9PSED|nr:SIR2 family protein [Pseudomonas coleopterorum]WNC11645.1 SIR2 family protein [Pseudomonas coleopterorum]